MYTIFLPDLLIPNWSYCENFIINRWSPYSHCTRTHFFHAHFWSFWDICLFAVHVLMKQSPIKRIQKTSQKRQHKLERNPFGVETCGGEACVAYSNKNKRMKWNDSKHLNHHTIFPKSKTSWLVCLFIIQHHFSREKHS